jgi:hypothetical protein
VTARLIAKETGHGTWPVLPPRRWHWTGGGCRPRQRVRHDNSWRRPLRCSSRRGNPRAECREPDVHRRRRSTLKRAERGRPFTGSGRAQYAIAVKSTRELFAAFDPRPVAVSSPHNPDECFRRLVKVTTDRGDSWYLSPKTAMLPDPLSHGEILPLCTQCSHQPTGATVTITKWRADPVNKAQHVNKAFARNGFPSACEKSSR